MSSVVLKSCNFNNYRILCSTVRSFSSSFGYTGSRSKPEQCVNFLNSANSVKSTATPSISRSVFSNLRQTATFSSLTLRSLRYFWKGMGEMQSQQVSGLSDTTKIERPGKIVLSDAEWKAKLTPEQFSVCRKHGTERAWTGDLLDNKQKGTYTCACCNTPMFNSSTKFDSGSGWPSFFDALKDKDKSELAAVDIRVDTTHGMTRTEVLCGKCDAHLGHVFNDGPKPTGLRYCINSVCLKFKPQGESSSQKSDL